MKYVESHGMAKGQGVRGDGLFVVPTPIGNLGDMTFRGVEILRQVSLILAEDTRTSKKLLDHYGIETPMRSYHQHNEHQVVDRLVDEIRSRGGVALISDAGTPGISDPGFLLIRACVEAGVKVECLPGASSILPALVSSGFACDRFVYEGFLPHKKGRMKKLEALLDEERTVVLLESPHRLIKALIQMEEVFGPDQRVVVARELTKLHEEIRRGTVAELLAHFRENEPRGELVIVLEGRK